MIRTSTRTQTIVLAILIGSLSGCATSSRQGDSRTGSSSLLRSLTDPVSAIVSPVKFEFRQLVESKQYLNAARFYEKNQAKLDPSDAEVQRNLGVVAAMINWEREGDLRRAAANLRRWTPGDLVLPKNWRDINAATREAGSVIQDYERLPVVATVGRRSKAFNDLVREKSEIGARLSEAAWRAFENSRGEAHDFFEEYPQRVSAETFFKANETDLARMLATVSTEKAQLLLRDHSAQFPEKTRKLATLGVFRSSESVNGGKRAIWDVWPDLTEHGTASLTYSDVSAALYLVADPTRPAVEVPGSTLVGPDLQVSQLQSLGKPYVAVVVQRDATTMRKITSKREQQSQYVEGEYQVPNPEFAAAQANFITAQSNLSNTQMRNALNRPAGILGAVLEGFAEGISASAVARARDNLAATPTTITQRSFANYSFDVATVVASKEIHYDIVFMDLAAGKTKRLAKKLEQTKTFEIPYRMRPDDISNERFRREMSSEADLDSWEAEKVMVDPQLDSLMLEMAPVAAVPLSELGTISPLTSATLASRPSVGQGQLTREDPRFLSVVVVRSPTGSLGSGFYVDDYLVITNQHVVEGSKLVEIELRDGTEGVGQVVRSDIGADLALVRVTQRGVPVTLSSDAVAPGDSVDAIGHPRGLKFSLTRGIVSAVRRMRNPSVPGSSEMNVVQTDTPINPGNSGGPLFRGGSVIGVNTQKIRSGESLGFAVHASEIRSFISLH